MRVIRKKLLLSVFLILFIHAVGVVGYMYIEGWNFIDSLFMTVISITTVGYGEVYPLSDTGQIFTIVLIIVGVGIILYILGTEARIIIEGELQEIIGRKRMEKKIHDMKDHYIICGYGRMGRIIGRELKAKGTRFVVIEVDPPTIPNSEDTLIVGGNANSDDMLKKAGIDRAKGIIAVLPTDAENLFLVLSARELNPDLHIVTRASDEGSESKLKRAGADNVVSPYHTGGIRIANTIVKPAVVDFIEFATKSGNLELQLEEIVVNQTSKLHDQTLDQCAIGHKLGVIIVAIKKAGGSMQFNPTSNTKLEDGDTLIALGEPTKLQDLEELASC